MQKQAVLNLFRNRKSLTDLEIQGLVSINPNSIRPIRLDLLKNNFIIKTNQKRNGYTVYEYNEDYKPRRKRKTNVLSILRKNRNLLKKAYEDISALIKELS